MRCTHVISSFYFSEFYVEDGSYLRLQRIALGYTIPETSTKKIGFQTITLDKPNKLKEYLKEFTF